jgi:cellulase/cellobiase CelA1
LRLLAGDYYFVHLTFNSASRIEATSGTRIYVASTLAYRSAVVTAGGSPQPIFLGYAGPAALRMEAPFQGTLLAPSSEVFLGTGSGTSFRGTFQARILNVNPQSAIECVEGPDGQGPGPGPSCTDGIQNGAETDIDCGGPVCSACDIGEQCIQNSDCTSNVCTGGICQPPPGSVTANFQVTNDWGSGYCVTLRVTNGASIPTASWNVGLNTNFSTIYSRWNGVFSGSSGAVNVGPIAPWNAVIQPGTTNTSVGFCANRAFPGSGTLPFVTSATGTY